MNDRSGGTAYVCSEITTMHTTTNGRVNKFTGDVDRFLSRMHVIEILFPQKRKNVNDRFDISGKFAHARVCIFFYSVLSKSLRYVFTHKQK